MKTPLHYVWTSGLWLSMASSGVYAQNVPVQTDALAFDASAADSEILSALSEDYESQAKAEASRAGDLEIKVSRIHVDLRKEKEVEFSARTKWAREFVWKFGDGQMIAGQQHVKHSYTKPGTYEVVLLASNGDQSARKTMQVVVVDSSQPLELEEMEHYVVFPVNNKLETDIQLNLPKKEKDLVFQVQDVEGTPLFEYSLGRVRKNERVRVDLREIPDGKYYAVLKGKKFSLVSRLTIVR